ncbi:MAG: diguanylate cyclase [Rhodocyclaceae bacterium]
MRVLVIEDSRTTLDAVCRQLERLGIAAVAAANGAAGLEAYEREKPDLVLLDIILPDIDGFQVAERIRAKERNGEWTPIVFLTARNTDEDLERGIAAGGDDYLAKPVSATVLGAKLRAMQRILQMRGSLVALTRKLDVANRELRRLSSIDGLTGIANRRQFDETFAREWRRSVRMKRPLALVLCDIDFFKQYNDMYGHQAGDECLCRVARAIEASVRRPGDRVTRFGGEEFTVVLPETDAKGAAALADKVRAAVEAMAIPHLGSEAAQVVTISAGCASMMPKAADRASDLLHWADAALYEAKRHGRNRIVSYTLPETAA